jgi:CheY-like chemotaxis protein
MTVGPMMFAGDEIKPVASPRLKLLVVDDEPDVCVLLQTALQATNTAVVHMAGDAMDALSTICDEDQPFDGIFLDI